VGTRNNLLSQKEKKEIRKKGGSEKQTGEKRETQEKRGKSGMEKGRGEKNYLWKG